MYDLEQGSIRGIQLGQGGMEAVGCCTSQSRMLFQEDNMAVGVAGGNALRLRQFPEG